jgi:DNA-nicking Smr family endonuclease
MIDDESIEDIPEYNIITDVLDLHGAPLDQIPEMIHEFINNAVLLGIDRVRIIHGKGRSRLKYLTLITLQSNQYVSNLHDAPPESGGWGATIVELK